MITVGAVRLRPRGGRLSFSVALQSICLAPQHLAVDLAVESPGARSVRRRVFKIATLELCADQAETLRGTVALSPLVTTRALPGRHLLDLLVNGVAFPLGGFSVVPARSSPGKG